VAKAGVWQMPPKQAPTPASPSAHGACPSPLHDSARQLPSTKPKLPLQVPHGPPEVVPLVPPELVPELEAAEPVWPPEPVLEATVPELEAAVPVDPELDPPEQASAPQATARSTARDRIALLFRAQRRTRVPFAVSFRRRELSTT